MNKEQIEKEWPEFEKHTDLNPNGRIQLRKSQYNFARDIILRFTLNQDQYNIAIHDDEVKKMKERISYSGKKDDDWIECIKSKV